MGKSKIKKRLLKKGVSKKITLIFVIIGIIICLICIAFCLSKLEKKKIQNIRNHYANIISINKDTNIINNKRQIIGRIKKGLFFYLAKEKINKSNDDYFKIKDTNYYIYYKDTSKVKNNKTRQISNYIPFNQNIITKNKSIFYKNNKKVLTIKRSINLPIDYMDDNYYYVNYLGNDLQIQKKNVKIINHNNTNDKEANFISIIDVQ